ncbi:MAG: hypothetical protein WCC95_17980 [Candidatus Sulfotelmatobacter sp.]
MAKKWIGKAVKHPGRLTKAAAASGVSKLQKAEQWSHSSDPSKRAAGNLGKRFIKGALHTGGIVPEDGAYEMKKGEQVIPASGGNDNNYHGSEHYAHDNDRMKVPPSSDARKTVETVSSPTNHGCVIDAAPTVDGGADSGVGHWEGDCCDVKFVK